MAKKFGLLGYPLGHSFSKPYFIQKFQKLALKDHSFVLYECRSLDEFFANIRNENELRGFSVTIPYKETIIPFLNELDATAKEIGAVNCVKVTYESEKKILKGYNTDAAGFRNSVRPFLEPSHNRALVLGTGGAAKAVHFVLRGIGLDVWYVTRDKEKCKSEKCFAYDELNENVMAAFKLIVNATPLGMDHLPGAPAIPYRFLNSTHFCYDVVYNPPETEFLRRAREQGALTMNGLDMLYAQAEEAWKIWNS